MVRGMRISDIHRLTGGRCQGEVATPAAAVAGHRLVAKLLGDPGIDDAAIYSRGPGWMLMNGSSRAGYGMKVGFQDAMDVHRAPRGRDWIMSGRRATLIHGGLRSPERTDAAR